MKASSLNMWRLFIRQTNKEVYWRAFLTFIDNPWVLDYKKQDQAFGRIYPKQLHYIPNQIFTQIHWYTECNFLWMQQGSGKMWNFITDFFTYETTKSVVVKSWTIGIINRVVQLLIITYFIGWVVLRLCFYNVSGSDGFKIVSKQIKNLTGFCVKTL